MTDEFARQASMESELGIPSALFAPPVREIVELGKSQIGFMNLFAIPLFQGVTDVLPAMTFCVDELHRNKLVWEEKIAQEHNRAGQGSDSPPLDGVFSPRAMSMVAPSDAVSHLNISDTNSSPAISNIISHLKIKGLLNQTRLEPSQVVESEEPSSDLTSASPSESLQAPLSSIPRRLSKPPPSQLQLRFAASSATGLLDQPYNETTQSNGEPVQSAIPADPVVVNPPTPQAESSKVTTEKQRSSETTEGGCSATGDWGSQATSATTSKMPLSPSTKGTSIMSHDSEEINGAGQTPTVATPSDSNDSQTSGSTAGVWTNAGGVLDGKDLPMETVRNLKKKPSRFRLNALNFWKRSKSASPPIPLVGRRDRSIVGSAEEMSFDR